MYQVGGDDEKEEEVLLEREFLFGENGPYVETRADPLFVSMEDFSARDVFDGQEIDSWVCIFAFHLHRFSHRYTSPVPPILSIAR